MEASVRHVRDRGATGCGPLGGHGPSLPRVQRLLTSVQQEYRRHGYPGRRERNRFLLQVCHTIVPRPIRPNRRGRRAKEEKDRMKRSKKITAGFVLAGVMLVSSIAYAAWTATGPVLGLRQGLDGPVAHHGRRLGVHDRHAVPRRNRQRVAADRQPEPLPRPRDRGRRFGRHRLRFDGCLRRLDRRDLHGPDGPDAGRPGVERPDVHAERRGVP